MSIDAIVSSVYIYENGNGQLNLSERFDHKGVKHGPGQKVLRFDIAPEEVTSLNGREVWGCSGSLMLGDMKIADRIGYTKIRFIDSNEFNKATRRQRSIKK